MTERASQPRPTGAGEAESEPGLPPDENAALSALDAAIAELDRAATRLRGGDVDPEEAAALVEECAELAARVGSALEAAARAAASDEAPPSDQERLL